MPPPETSPPSPPSPRSPARRTLSEEEFNAVVEREIQNAPDGLSESQLEGRIMTAADRVAEQGDPKSVTGFLDNVVSSGGRFLSDTGQGLLAAGKLAGAGFVSGGNVTSPLVQSVIATDPTLRGITEAAAHPIRTLQQLKDAIKARYGSGEAIGNTLYEDPIGAAADVASLAGGVGLGARASGLPRVARIAGTVERATNPVSAVAAPVSRLAREAGLGTIQATVRPSPRIRDDFGGGRAIAETIADERLLTDTHARRAVQAAAADTDAALQQSAATIRPTHVARGGADRLRELLQRRRRVGATTPADEAAVLDRLRRIRQENPVQIPVTEANALKQEAQDLAYEAGRAHLSVPEAIEQAIAQAFRSEIETAVPTVGPLNARTQRLMGAERSLTSAADRSPWLSNAGVLALLTSGNPWGAALLKALDTPTAGTAAGIALTGAGRGLSTPGLHRAAILARLAGEREPPTTVP